MYNQPTCSQSSLISVLCTTAIIFSNLIDQALAQATATETLNEDNTYLELAKCAANCIQGYWDRDVGNAFSCTKPYLNGCFCEADRAPVAYTHISACIEGVCTTTSLGVQISSAWSFYQRYCSTALPGYVAAGGSEATPTSGNGAAALNTTGGAAASTTTTQLFVATVISASGAAGSGMITSFVPTSVPESTGTGSGSSPSSTASSRGSGHLLESDKIALGVGVPSAVFAALGVLVYCYRSEHVNQKFDEHLGWKFSRKRVDDDEDQVERHA